MSFPNLPAEYEDPWYTKFINWATSVQNRITGTETVANAAATKAYADGIKATADAALPSATFDTRFATRVKVDNSVGRTTHVWDATNNRWQLVGGDTGPRNITALVNDVDPVAAGTILIYRTGRTVTLEFQGVRFTSGDASTTHLISGLLLSGFRPRGLMRLASPYPNGYALPSTNGDLTIVTGSASSIYTAFQWVSYDGWPTVLPGSASGSIPST